MSVESKNQRYTSSQDRLITEYTDCGSPTPYLSSGGFGYAEAAQPRCGAPDCGIAATVTDVRGFDRESDGLDRRPRPGTFTVDFCYRLPLAWLCSRYAI